MFAKSLAQDGHVHRFLIEPRPNVGWELREEHDSEVVRRTHYTDWHRVERARALVNLRISLLRSSGWTEA